MGAYSEAAEFYDILYGDKVIIFNPTIEKISQSQRILGEISFSNLDLEKDPNQSTRPRPEGVILVESNLYVTLTNLNSNFISGGPGYVIKIDTREDEIKNIIPNSQYV